MNDVSKAIVGVLSRYNAHAGLRAAYTFDAGPNCVVYCLKVRALRVPALSRVRSCIRTFVTYTLLPLTRTYLGTRSLLSSHRAPVPITHAP